jgi:hypothetical protein
MSHTRTPTPNVIPLPRNSGTSQRSASRPLGQEEYPSVWLGNVLAARTLIIIMIAHALGCFWVLEQPRGSMMELHPRFQEVLKNIRAWRHSLSMQDYGAPSPKPTWLYASQLVALEKRFIF